MRIVPITYIVALAHVLRLGGMDRLVRRLLLTFILVLACSVAYCAQTLTLNLETPSLNDKAPAASTAPAAKPMPPPSDKVKIGHVGLVTASVASIYQSKSTSSRVYAKVKAETPLAVVREEGEWFGVMMVNRTTGWILASAVRLIGYDLVAKKADINRATALSRGLPTSRGDIAECDIIRTAMQYAGVSYVYGGTSPVTGMDCSAFVRSVFSQYNVSLPRTAREQSQVGEGVSFDQLQPGDRLYFAVKNSYPDHCGIYAGGGYFVHCSSRKRGVAVDNLSTAVYSRSLVAARRS